MLPNQPPSDALSEAVIAAMELSMLQQHELHPLTQDNIRRLCGMARAALAVAPPSSKPVAWFDKFNNCVWHSQESADHAAKGGNTIIPLYASPPPSSDARAVELLREARQAFRYDGNGHPRPDRAEVESLCARIDAFVRNATPASASEYVAPPFDKAHAGFRKWTLLPCPFCGASPKVKEIQHHYWNVCVECPRCYCKTGEYNNATHFDDMVKAWNLRAVQSETPRGDTAKLPDALEEFVRDMNEYGPEASEAARNAAQAFLRGHGGTSARFLPVVRDGVGAIQRIADSAMKTGSKDVCDWYDDMQRIRDAADTLLAAAPTNEEQR